MSNIILTQLFAQLVYQSTDLYYISHALSKDNKIDKINKVNEIKQINRWVDKIDNLNRKIK